MAAPGIPTDFIVQQGNGVVLLSWANMPGATSYNVQRSTDNVTFTDLVTAGTNSYQDEDVAVGVQYWYKVASSNGTLSPYTNSASAIPTLAGTESLLALRQQAQQRADRENSSFLSTAEWNNNINQSATELYDLLTTVYEDYYTLTPYQFVTDGSTSMYDLPPNFYKLQGVDLGLDNSVNAWVTLQKFDFIQRNRYVYPNISSTFLGVFNARYRLVGNKLMFIPTPSANQTVRVWYMPRMPRLLKDTDILDGINGWTEIVILDAAIKALQKEESDVTLLEAQKQMLIDRIMASAQNRDIGAPDTISNTRRNGSEGGGGFDGSFGGY